MATTLIIRYEGTAADPFDREYYCGRHLPRAVKEWGPYGMTDIRTFFPASPSAEKGTICITECVFKDRAALDAAFAAPCTPGLLADIPNFTAVSMNAGILEPMP